MSDSHAEQLDPSKLGEEVGDDERAADDFPPERPLGVDDPNILADGSIAEDDVESRDDRHVKGAADGDQTVADAAEAGGLIEPGADPDVRDDERQLIADTGDREDAAEAAAVHVDDSAR